MNRCGRTLAGSLRVAAILLATGVGASTDAPAAKPDAKAALPSCPVVASLGKREVILEHGQHGLRYFPDGCLAFVRSVPPYRILLAAGVSTFLLEGGEMKTLASLGEVLKPGEPGSFDNGYAGISGVARDPTTGDLLGFYHAEDRENLPAIPGGIPGFYCCIALAVSKDDGASFRKAGPVITGSLPKDLKGRADQGCGETCILTDRQQRYLYAYYSDHSRVNNRGVQICLARCRITDAATTDHWTKYHNGEFEQPGLGGKDTPVISAQAMQADAIFPHVTFVPELNRYVMAFNIIAHRELRQDAKPVQSGVYMACSKDGIRWSIPTQLVRIHSIPAGLGREIGWHPTLLVSTVKRGTASGWLYYSYSESWGHKAPHKPHYLVGQPITFSIPTD